jgi:ATP-dependent exoDNAse (exonuclease V) beta subunit
MSPERLVDHDAREAIRSHLDVTLVVEAAAGTGKTTELVARILGLLTTGRATLASMVAVTFTEKAAGEMKLRLRTEIERARQSDTATDQTRAHLDVALSELEAAHIGTIHSFCAELLRERPVEARVDPLFMAADEAAQERLYDEAFERFFQRELQEPSEAVRRMLRKRHHTRDSGGPRNLLYHAGLTLIEQRDFDCPWRRDPFNRTSEVDAIVTRLRDVAKHWDVAVDKTTWLTQNLIDVKRFVYELDRREQISNERDYDGLEEELRSLSRLRTWRYVGGPKQFAKGVTKQLVIDERDAVRADLESVLARADADLAACLHHDLQRLVEEYDGIKKKLGKLDFLDLLLETRRMLVSNAVVRAELQGRFTHVLVDEFQDTDPLQAEILLLICGTDPSVGEAMRVVVKPGKLFVVGDPKQSIYRFRRADVMLYERVKRHLLAQGARLLHLQTSFRSVPAIQSAINAAFAPRMQGSEDGSQADYVALEKYREDPRTRPAVVALPVPRPYSDKSGRVTAWQVSESLPDATAAFVDWLVRESGWTIEENGQSVRIEARHVCLLFRRFVNYGDDVTRAYVRALEQRRVAHVLVGGRSFYKREEVVALKNALAAIEWPDDELSVFATLRGPLIAIPDDSLLLYRSRHKALRPIHIPDDALLDDSTRPIGEALAMLRTLHKQRNRRPIADTIAELLERTRAHAGIAIWPTGEQALANLLRLLDDARRFEAAGATSFRAFVRHLEDEEERGGGAEAPVVEEGTDGVRIMTVHKAKGLEFPVVVLVDPSCSLTSSKPSRWIDSDKRLWVTTLQGCTPIELLERRDIISRHDEEEAVRLTYVAATRARDLLVVPVVGDEGIDPSWWLAPLSVAVYPRPDDWRAVHEAPGCPTFGDDSVLERPSKAERDKRSAVRPGLHLPQAGTHNVVWWDPRALKLRADQDAGLRQQRILAVDQASGHDAESEREHDAWQKHRAECTKRGSVETYRVDIVTTRSKHGGPVSLLPVAVHRTDAVREGRPRGKAFGVLVHAVLSEVRLDGADDEVVNTARAAGRMVGASAIDVDHAALAAIAALRHPLVREAARAEHRRESPILLREPDDSLIEGVLDLAFRRGDKWVVVDFKTDRELADAQAAYEAQVRLYARAVSETTGCPTEAALLLV